MVVVRLAVVVTRGVPWLVGMSHVVPSALLVAQMSHGRRVFNGHGRTGAGTERVPTAAKHGVQQHLNSDDGDQQAFHHGFCGCCHQRSVRPRSTTAHIIAAFAKRGNFDARPHWALESRENPGLGRPGCVVFLTTASVPFATLLGFLLHGPAYRILCNLFSRLALAAHKLNRRKRCIHGKAADTRSGPRFTPSTEQGDPR